MPIYEYGCPECRKIFSFLAKRLQSRRPPVCPKCGNKKLIREISRFAAIRGAAAPKTGEADERPPEPDIGSPRMERFMREMERDMAHLDENNPRHMAHMMRRMKEAMPGEMMPKEMDEAIRRLEAGEDPEKIEADMGDVFGSVMGEDEEGGGGGLSGMGRGYSHDSGLYDM